MDCRTDLAIEARELTDSIPEGVEIEESLENGLRITRIEIGSKEGSRLLHKPEGRYITIEGLDLRQNFRDTRDHIEAVAGELRAMLPDSGGVLAAGLGNRSVTPDALGPASMDHVIATRHIKGELAKSVGLDRLRTVSVISTGVLGQTGMEAGEIILGIVKLLKPQAVIVVDALVAKEADRLGCTIQIGSSGIVPGSGVGNHRMRLDRETLGVPVISVGVPTVAEASYFFGSKSTDTENGRAPKKYMITPREIDLLTKRASKLVGMAINCALQTEYDFDTLASIS